ncbi:cobalamin biosynthesis protein [Shewanella gaetbuli]|uniref:Cobalamin biosynthesis protein n=1 Tax=Shewanella gaetbuli TaxID=220752 RepID=A0A9X1ZHN9_9GAMM|nr:cobalamin biosynthesis protein [Shewanella gaetbuli]MCL1141923.1 cobalamin biosynthesis protein [Shewanella gaetbuli]
MEHLLLQNELIQGCLQILLAFIVAYFAPLSQHWQPLYWFGELAKILAQKVNHPDRPPSQQMTAGILASLLLVIPFAVICIFLMEMAAYPWFFNIIVLYCCFSEYQFAKSAQQVLHALKQHENQTAKDILAVAVEEDTSQLSSLGLTKTCIEKTLTTPIYGLVASILFFAFGGIAMVLTAQLLKKLESSWSPYRVKFSIFASFVAQFNRVLFWLPRLIWHFALAVQFGQFGARHMLAKDIIAKGLNNDYPTVSLGANLLRIELGGPQQFTRNPHTFNAPTTLAFDAQPQAATQFEKVRLSKVFAGSPPNAQDIQHALTIVKNGHFFILSLTLLLPVLWVCLQILS